MKFVWAAARKDHVTLKMVGFAVDNHCNCGMLYLFASSRQYEETVGKTKDALEHGVTFAVAFSTPVVLRVLLMVRVFIFLSILVVKYHFGPHNSEESITKEEREHSIREGAMDRRSDALLIASSLQAR